MTTRFASRCSIAAIALGSLLAVGSVANAGGADPKIVAQLVREIEQLSSLYAKNEKPVVLAALPKFAAKSIDRLQFSEVPPLETARANWKANPEKYAKVVPLRGAYFTAAENIEQARRLIVPALFLPRDALGPKAKAAFLQKQAPLGLSIFKQEQALAQIQEAEENRNKEKSFLWRARFDWVRAITEADVLFLFEYNFTLGQVRADNLPELKPDHDGWKIAFQPKVGVTEKKAKDLAKQLKKRWAQIQEDYPDTPFAYFAERESRRDPGMTWVARKK
jgi:hypothetical protein